MIRVLEKLASGLYPYLWSTREKKMNLNLLVGWGLRADCYEHPFLHSWLARDKSVGARHRRLWFGLQRCDASCCYPESIGGLRRPKL